MPVAAIHKLSQAPFGFAGLGLESRSHPKQVVFALKTGSRWALNPQPSCGFSHKHAPGGLHVAVNSALRRLRLLLEHHRTLPTSLAFHSRFIAGRRHTHTHTDQRAHTCRSLQVPRTYLSQNWPSVTSPGPHFHHTQTRTASHTLPHSLTLFCTECARTSLFSTLLPLGRSSKFLLCFIAELCQQNCARS